MRETHAPFIKTTSYWDFFCEYYSPKIQKIDLLLKTAEEDIPPADAAAALGITREKLHALMREASISHINRPGFLHIMMRGESPVCKLYRREQSFGPGASYSPAALAYIYNLDEAHIAHVCALQGYDTEIPPSAVPQILKNVFICIIS